MEEYVGSLKVVVAMYFKCSSKAVLFNEDTQ